MYDTQIFRSAIYSILPYLLHKRVLKFYCFLGACFLGLIADDLLLGVCFLGGLLRMTCFWWGAFWGLAFWEVLRLKVDFFLMGCTVFPA